MRFRPVIAALASSALLVTLAVAQEPAASPPPAFQVTTLELSVGTMTAFRNGRALVAEAAKALNLPAEFTWWDYNEGNRTIIVAPRNRDNVLRGSNARARIREANPEAEKKIAAAFEGTQVRLVSQELIIAVPNQSYEPAMAPGEAGGISITTVQVNPGQNQVFNEAIAALDKVRADIKYPYPVRAYRVRFGESRLMFVTFFDSREAMYGKNEMGRLLAGNAAATAAWQAALEKLRPAVASFTNQENDYAARQSYAP